MIPPPPKREMVTSNKIYFEILQEVKTETTYFVQKTIFSAPPLEGETGGGHALQSN